MQTQSHSSRRWPSPLAAVLITTLALCTPPAAFAGPGDVNNDGQITIADAVAALRIAAGRTKADGYTANAGDVAGGAGQTPDGAVTILDAVRIARAASGLDTGLGGGGSSPTDVLPKLDTVSFTGNFTKNYTLEAGYRVKGTVTDMAGNPLSSTIMGGQSMKTTTGTIDFEHATKKEAFDDQLMEDEETAFEVVLAKGQNKVTISTEVFEIDFSSGKYLTYTIVQDAVPSTLNVTGAASGLTFKRPSLPAAGTIKGTVTGSGITNGMISFETDSGVDAYAPVETGAYTIVSGPGTGDLSISGSLTSNPNVTVLLGLNSTPVTVNSGSTTTRNVTIPTLATLSGAISVPAGESIGYLSLSDGAPGRNNSYLSNYSGPSYTLALPAGPGNLAIGLMDKQFGSASLRLVYNQAVTLSAGTNTRNITLPAVPANVTFTGKVTAPGNVNVAGAMIVAFGNATTGYTAVAQTVTNASGNFSLTLPAGSYTVFITPEEDE